MFIVMNRIPVNPNYQDVFEERFAQREGQVDQMEGFVSFQLLRPQNPDDPYIVMTTWQTEAHFRTWTDSDAFKQQHGQQTRLPKEALLGRPKLELSEVV